MSVFDDAKSIFLANMSHEMRTPLNAIMGMTSLGLDTSDVSRKNYALKRIEDASRHLLSLVNDVLDMSKIEAGRLDMNPCEFFLEAMLEKITSVINFRVCEKRQLFIVDVEENVPQYLVGDDSRLTQVLINLLTNAVKFTHDGGKIKLSVRMLREEGASCLLQFEVSDDGIGVSPAQQAKLFDAFGQVEKGVNRRFGGAGLGLAIARTIVEMMRGEIWMESELGKGSRFFFTAWVGKGTKSVRCRLSEDVDWDSVKILLADAGPESVNRFKYIFKSLGVDYVLAGSTDEAERALREQFDIYYINITMPGVMNPEFAEKITEASAPGSAVLFSRKCGDDMREAFELFKTDRFLISPVMGPAVTAGLNARFCKLTDFDDGSDYEGAFCGKNLLLVEDIEINREIVLSILDGTDISADCAENGLEAVRMVSENPGKYDIILMDMQMPEMDGLEATRQIRAMPEPCCRSVPIIAMTANVFKEDIENCLAAGMTEHMGKPLKFDEVISKLSRYIGK